MDGAEIKALGLAQEEYVIRMRREFHRDPEPSGEEYRTRERLIREIEAMGLSCKRLPGTGLIAVIEGGLKGPVRLLRADMDGLFVQEEEQNLSRKKDCISGRPGLCHACGHDAHMAMLLGAMRVMAENRERLPGTVYCCFEEGEETNCGISAMLKALEGVPIEECFALHVYSGLRAGQIDVEDGPRMAGTVRVSFHIKGRSGHGARPDQAVNPIIPAAYTIAQLDSAFRAQLDAEEPVTLGICQVAAGESNNVIPERAYIGGTARFFEPSQGEKALAIIGQTASQTAAIHQCSAEFAPEHKVSLNPVINSPKTAERVRDALAGAFGEGVLGRCGRWYASESYSKYLERWGGALGLLGIQNEALGTGAPHHNGKFDLDESALALGVCAHLGFVFSEG